jgi:hypothetical protein
MRTPVTLLTCAAVLLASLTLAQAGAGAAAPVSGSLTVNGQKVALVKAYVDESPDDVIVVLASKEIPRDVLPFIGEEVARKRQIHAVTFTISRAKRALEPRGLKGVYYPGPEMGFVGIAEGNAKLVLARLDANGVEGRITTPKPVTLSDLTYSFDASFSLPLGAAAPAPPAAKVEVTGDTSPPARAYADYHRSAFTGNADKIRGFLAKPRLQEFDKADPKTRALMLDLLKSNPEQIRITKATSKGATATLTVEGLNETATRSTAEVAMVNEGGAWKVQKEKWSVTDK